MNVDQRTPAERLLDSIRRGWWLIVGTPVVLVVLTAVVLPYVAPQYHASGWIRIDRERSPFRALEGLEALEFLTGGGSGLMTEITWFQTRSAALEADQAVGVRFELMAPKSARRSRVFQGLEADAGVPAMELRFTRAGDGFELRTRVRQTPEVWRPYQRSAWTELPPQTVRPGAPFEVAVAPPGVRGRLAPTLPPGENEFVLRVHDDAGLFRLMDENLGVGRLSREADIVELRFRSADPELARDVVNTLADRFVEGRQGLRTRQNTAAAALLEAQLVGVRAELEGAEAQFLAFRERERVTAPEAQVEGALIRLLELEGERDRLRAESQGLAALLAELTELTERAGVAGAAGRVAGTADPLRRLVGFPSLLSNPGVAALLTQAGELDNEYAALMETRLPSDPAARGLETRIRDIEGQLRAIAETYLDGINRRADALDANLAQGQDALRQVPEVELQFMRLARSVEFLSELSIALEVRLREAQIRSQVDEMGVQLIDPARAPETPSQPRPKVALALSLLLGGLLGGAGALARYGL